MTPSDIWLPVSCPENIDMSRIIFALLVVLAIFSASSFGKPQECGQHETFTACGSSCEPSCTPRSGLPTCTFECKIGCQCNAGFLRNSAGACVDEHHC